MSYAALFVIVLITIITIVTAILFTIALDNLARIPDPADSISDRILENVVSIGTYVVIFLIFLIALDLTIAILVFYHARRGTQSNFAFYLTIALIIATIGLLVLEIHSYNEINIFEREVNDIIITSSINLMFWGIVLTVIALILSFILLALL